MPSSVWVPLYFYLTLPLKLVDSLDFIKTLHVVNFKVLQVIEAKGVEQEETERGREGHTWRRREGGGGERRGPRESESMHPCTACLATWGS
jgi:hypothetical protein